MKPKFRYRVCNIPLTEEQFFTLQKYLPYGMKGRIFKFIVEDLIEQLEKDAPTFLAGIYTREIKLMSFMKGNNEE